jgi:hypothetical protein
MAVLRVIQLSLQNQPVLRRQAAALIPSLARLRSLKKAMLLRLFVRTVPEIG